MPAMELSPRFDFGKALSVDAEAVGQPGQRRFRLLVRSATESASIWMEKEQLAGVGRWLAEVVQKLDEERPTAEPDVEALPFPPEFDLDFRAGQLTLGYSEEGDLFTIQAAEALPNADAQPPLFCCGIGRGQSRVLSRKIERVIAGGRLTCPFCEGPIDPAGHSCPRSNGHRRSAPPV